MKILENIRQLHWRFGKSFVEMFQLEQEFRGLKIHTPPDNSDLVRLAERFWALSLSTPFDSADLLLVARQLRSLTLSSPTSTQFFPA